MTKVISLNYKTLGIIMNYELRHKNNFYWTNDLIQNYNPTWKLQDVNAPWYYCFTYLSKNQYQKGRNLLWYCQKNSYIYTTWFKQEDSSMIFHQKAKYLTTIVFMSTKTSNLSHQNSTQILAAALTNTIFANVIKPFVFSSPFFFHNPLLYLGICQTQFLKATRIENHFSTLNSFVHLVWAYPMACADMKLSTALWRSVSKKFRWSLSNEWFMDSGKLKACSYLRPILSIPCRAKSSKPLLLPTE